MKAQYVKVCELTFAPTIAVVDDDADVCNAVAELLEVLDYRWEVFEHPEKFLATHTKGRFDCLITDLNMKSMTGLELQEKLSSVDPDLSIIFMSAQSSPEATSRALRSGAVAFLSKPIDANVLHRHIISAVDRGSDGLTYGLRNEP